MRIISDFHDYYDGTQRHFVEERDLIYLRKTEEKIIPRIVGKTRLIPGNPPHESPLWLGGTIIGFCGRIYPLLKVIYDPPGVFSMNNRIEAYCYSHAELDAFIAEHFPNKNEYYLMSEKDRGRTRLAHSRWPHASHERIARWWAEASATSKNYFEEYKCPIFTLTPGAWWGPVGKHEMKLVTNPMLKDFRFQQLFHSRAAFLAIREYWGSIARPEKTIPEVSNDDLIEAKGFDRKWSFRTPPTKKR